MKVFLAFAFLVVGISATAVPKTGMKFDFTNERLVSGQIESAIEDVSQAIKDAGLDPFHIERESSSYALPVPVLFNYEAIIDNLLSTGLSDIRIHRVNYSVLTNRLNFDIELPLIHLSVGSAKADAELLSNELGFETSGTIEIVSIRVSGVVRVSVGIISGISIRSVNVEMKLGDVNSDVNLVILGRDYSKTFNDFVGVFVPYTIKAHEREINELLGIVLKEVIEANLN